MSDLISRQAVLDYPIRLDHYDEEHGNRHFVLGIESVMEYVEYLPSAEPQWIPVSDGLPELKYEHNHLGLRFKYSDNVLVVINRGSYLECDESFEIMHLSDDMNGKELYWCGYDYDCDFGDVLAWMQLPPLYEGGDEYE